MAGCRVSAPSGVGAAFKACGLTAALWGAFAAAPASAQDPAACAALQSLKLPSTALEITSAQYVAAGPGPAGTPGRPGFAGTLPAHCRVDGVLERRTGVNGVEYGIRFALALPDGWTGQFLFQGGGGLNGNVAPPLGGQVAGSVPALARGFAVVTNDTGHQGTVFDGSFFADQEAALNFLWLANGKVTVVAKAIIDAYYRKPAAHSYFVGCSTGGREAMIMSQRYPTYFDGLVSGAPAMRTGFSNLGMRSVAVALAAAAQRDANGAVVAGSALSEGDKKLIVDSLLKTCDADDGLADGLIFDPLALRFRSGELGVLGRQERHVPEPRASERGANKRCRDRGPRAAGRSTRGISTTPASRRPRRIPGVLNGAAGPVGPRVPPTTQDVDAEAAQVLGEPSTLGDTNAWTNLSTFLRSWR